MADPIARVSTPSASAPQTAAPATSPAPRSGPAPQSGWDRFTSGVRRMIDGAAREVDDTLFAREPWERYRARPVELPPTFPARHDVPVTEGIDPALHGMVYRATHDIHYDGDFTVAGQSNAVARFSDVMARPDWPQFIQDHLTVGKAQPGDPLRVLIPGLNTELKETERRVHVVARDTNFAIAQLDNGSTSDLEPLILTIPGGRRVQIPPRNREWLSAVFQKLGLSFEASAEWSSQQPRDAQGRVEMPPGSGQWLNPREVRGLMVALNELSDPNKQLIENTQRLLMAHIDRADAPPLELWGYSEGSIVIGMAMRDLEARYLSERMRGCPPEQRASRLAALKARFRSRLDRISVLCIGSAYGQFATPVRRVDFYAANSEDPVARFAGSSRMMSAFRAINDTVFFSDRFDAMIAYEQPFGGFDAHNLFASGGSALAEFMDQNGTRAVRDIYERERAGTLVRPTLADVTERVHRNGGERELWNPPKK